MNLKAIKFCRFCGQKNEWSIEGKPIDEVYNQWVTFEGVNLIVGKNATGKSKTINVIRQLADLLAGDIKLSNPNPNLAPYSTSEYSVEFDNNGENIEYFLSFRDNKVKQEILKINNVEKLNRGKGKLFYEEINQFLSFEMEEDKLAVSRVDTKQQPFFEPLHNWGKSLNLYRFGGKLGKDTFLRDVNAIKLDGDVDLKDGDDVTEIFIRGKNKFGQTFIDSIIKDMSDISYSIKDISTTSINIFPVVAYGLGVQEEDIDVMTDQKEMSQGMFRAFSLLVQLNYSLSSKVPSCILIDDIGEGLDYDRSKSLIQLIIEKVKNSSVQVIMTTNDRFVMNKIPLEYWSVIHRIPKKSLFYNYRNSKEIFEEYKYSGLSNFDFLTTEFYLSGFEKEEK